MIDSHTHIDVVPAPDDEVVAAARGAGVERMLTVGTDADRSRLALEQAGRFEGTVFAAVGHHPNSATGFRDEDAAVLEELARDPRCRAVGETGLDFFRDYAPRADQERAFRAQAEIARRVAKPLVIHTRAAEEETLGLLAEAAGDLRVIMHCFSMSERVDECIDRGYWLSFAGNVTYPKSVDLARAAARVPLDRLLVETDAPYLTPQPVRKHRNQPAYVVHTAAFVAERRGMAYEELEAAVERTAAELFGW